MAQKKTKIQYFPDDETNIAFNEDVECAVAEYEEAEKRTVSHLILDYRKLTPSWDYSTGMSVLNIALMEVQLQRITKKLSGGDKGVTRDGSTTIHNLFKAIEVAKELIGLDAKAMKGKGKGSISETFSDVVREFKFDKRRFVCKPVFGLRSKVQDGDGDGNEFAKTKDEDVDRYLATAEAE